jgi:hypothetical protein
VETRLCSSVVNGAATDLVFSQYADKCMLVVTQLKSLGTVLYIKCVCTLLRAPSGHVRWESRTCRQDSTFDGHTTYNISTLLGKRDEPFLTLCARRVAEQAQSAGSTKYACPQRLIDELCADARDGAGPSCCAWGSSLLTRTP